MATKLEKIMKKLTGDIAVDKKFLIDNITSLIDKGEEFEVYSALGDKLFELVIKSGLNEKKFDENRLLSRADDFLYEGKADDALELLKAIEAKEDWTKKENFFYFNNDIEACLYLKLNPGVEKLNWMPSNKNYILILLAQTYLKLGEKKLASRVIDRLKDINPVSIDADILMTKVMPEKPAMKKYDLLVNSLDKAYSYQMLAKVYVELGDLLVKTELELALSLYFLAKIALDKTSVDVKVKQALNEIESLNEKKYDMDVEKAIAELEKFGIRTYFSENAFDAVCEGYMAYLQNDNATDEGKLFYRELTLSVCDGNEKFVKDLEKIARGK